MNITITDQPNCKKQVRLQVTSEVVRAMTDKTAADLARKANIPGFRPGHVPTSVIKSRFRKELRNQVAADLLPDAIQDAAREKNFRIVGQPSLDEFNFGDDESLNAIFTVEVAPDFELASYKGLQIKKRVYKVRDEDVDKELNHLREHHAELVPVEDRPAQQGDIVTVNWTGSIVESEDEAEAEASGENENVEKSPEGEDADGDSGDDDIRQDDVEVLLGEDGFLKQFTDALAGASVGDVREFHIDYPDNYSDPNVAGQSVDYRAEVTAVRLKELPELDDDFALSVDEKFKTLDDLRADIRTELESQANARSKQEVEKEVMNQLLDRYRFDVPQGLVEQQMNAKLKAMLQRLQIHRLGIDLNQLDIDKLREPFRKEAEHDVRLSFVIDRIAEAEEVEATDEELDEEIAHLAEHLGQSPAALKARLTRDEALDSMRLQIKSRKALDLVIASAEIETEEVEGFGEGNPTTDEETKQAAQ